MSQCHDNYQTPLPVNHLPLRVRDLMTPRPVTVEPTAPIQEIATLMHMRDIRAVPVVDIGDSLVGIVSEVDVICREGYPTVRSHTMAALLGNDQDRLNRWSERAEGLTAEEIMSKDVVTCSPDETVTVVTLRLLNRDVRSIPVVDQGRLVGIISRHDLLRMVDRPDSEVRWRVERLLGDPGWGPVGDHLVAEIQDGVVLLRGTVPNAESAGLFAAVLRHVPGVVEVIDHTELEAAA